MGERCKALCAGILAGILSLTLSLSAGYAVDKAWPAEPANSVPEVENWQVVKEVVRFTLNDLIITKFHQDPNDSSKLGFTLWFPNKDKNYELEVFVRIVDFEKTDLLRARGSLKLQNGNWSEAIAGDRLLASDGLLNGEPAVIFRAVDDNGETKYLRAFLIKDLIKPTN